MNCMELPKIYDTFPYNGESIVWLRLKLYAPVVDHFYIIESRYTFSGVRKDKLYSEIYTEQFQAYKDKITFIIIEEYDKISYDNWISKYNLLASDWMIDKRSWYRENYQREMVLPYLQDKTYFILLVTDCDEIIRPNLITELKEYMYYELETPTCLKMDMYNYNFSWYKNLYWELGFVVNDIFLRSNTFSHVYRGLLSICRVIKNLSSVPNIRTIENSGWHCSYFMSLDDITRKVESFAHIEFNQPEYTTKEHIYECIQHGKELFGRDIQDKITPDMLFPADYHGLPDNWEIIQQELLESQEINGGIKKRINNPSIT